MKLSVKLMKAHNGLSKHREKHQEVSQALKSEIAKHQTSVDEHRLKLMNALAEDTPDDGILRTILVEFGKVCKHAQQDLDMAKPFVGKP